MSIGPTATYYLHRTEMQLRLIAINLMNNNPIFIIYFLEYYLRKKRMGSTFIQEKNEIRTKKVPLEQISFCFY